MARSAAGAGRGRLVGVLFISSAVFAAELVTGLLANSLALLADASHVFTDVSGVGLALGAIWFAARSGGERRSFGYYRLEIIAAGLNAVLLFGVAFVVLSEAWRRLTEEPQILTGPMMVVAAVGLAANVISAVILRGPASRSLNLRAAYLEVLTDALGSVAVLVAGATIALTGFRAADAIASALIGLLIVPRTWALLREVVDILLESSPKGMTMSEVRQHILETPGVSEVHDLHAWTITSGMNVVSAHVVIEDAAEPANVLRGLGRCLAGCFDVEHSTFQLETADHRRLETASHA